MMLKNRVATPFAMFICISCFAGLAHAQVLDAISDTILLNNGTPTSQATADAEDNFGGRAELIVGNNGQNARGGLIRFDVSSLADAINDAGQVVSSAKLVLNTADARADIQPETESIFDVYAVVPENAGWLEGTQAGSRAGWSGQFESASQLYLANPEFEPEDALSNEIVDEFDDILLWHSASLNDGFPIPFEVGLDTDEESIGTVSTDEIDGGFLEIELEPSAVNALLPQWLTDKEENAGLYIYPTEGTGQWFFESIEGFEEEAVDLELVFDVGGIRGDFNSDGKLDAADVDSLVEQINGAKDASFDVSGDGAVDVADLNVWIKDIQGTWIGDANLDGEFNSTDFVVVFGAGEYEDATAGNSTWEEGDWNGDGDFNSSDFVAAFSDGGYEKGPVAAVPEPQAPTLLVAGMIALTITRKRRSAR